MRRKLMGLAAMAVLLVNSAAAQEKQGKQGKQCEPPRPAAGNETDQHRLARRR